MKWRWMAISLIITGTWWLVTNWKSRMGVIICDVGQGSGAIVIQGKNEILLDTGPKNGKMVECLEKYLPMGDKTIEGVIVSHWDGDHCDGLEQIKQYYQVNNVWSCKDENDQLRKGDAVVSGDVKIDVLSPMEISGESNIDSLVLKVKLWSKVFWFLGDAPAQVEEYLSWRDLWGGNGGVLVVSHHGSKSGTSEALLKTLKPDEAVISVGAKNSYGLPSKETMERLDEYGVGFRRTDMAKDISFWVY